MSKKTFLVALKVGLIFFLIICVGIGIFGYINSTQDERIESTIIVDSDEPVNIVKEPIYSIIETEELIFGDSNELLEYKIGAAEFKIFPFEEEKDESGYFEVYCNDEKIYTSNKLSREEVRDLFAFEYRGDKYILISNHSRGAHCCLTTYVFKLDKKDNLELLEIFDLRNAGISIDDLTEKNGRLYLSIDDDRFVYFYVSHASSYFFKQYYLISDEGLTKSRVDFKEDYLKEAEKCMGEYEKSSDFEVQFSNLLGATVNYILADEEEKAWREFDEKFNAMQLIPENVDSEKVKREIKDKMENIDNYHWETYQNRELGFEFKYPPCARVGSGPSDRYNTYLGIHNLFEFDFDRTTIHNAMRHSTFDKFKEYADKRKKYEDRFVLSEQLDYLDKIKNGDISDEFVNKLKNGEIYFDAIASPFAEKIEIGNVKKINANEINGLEFYGYGENRYIKYLFYRALLVEDNNIIAFDFLPIGNTSDKRYMDKDDYYAAADKENGFEEWDSDVAEKMKLLKKIVFSFQFTEKSGIISDSELSFVDVYFSDDVQGIVSLRSPDMTVTKNKTPYCGADIDANVYNGNFYLSFKESKIDLGGNEFVEGESHDGSLFVNKLNPDNNQDFFTLYKYGACNWEEIKFFGYDFREQELTQYKFKIKDEKIVDKIHFSSLKVLPSRDFVSKIYNNRLKNYGNTRWRFNSEGNVFEEIDFWRSEY